MKFTILTNEESMALYYLHRIYWNEANKCAECGAYLSGCVMLGSALEAILFSMVDVYADDVEQKGQPPRLKNGDIKPLLKWTLSDLIKVAIAMNWFQIGFGLKDNWISKKAKIGNYADYARSMRNLVHPLRYLEDNFHSRITKKMFEQQAEIVEVCQEWLAFHNNEELRKEIEIHDSKSKRGIDFPEDDLQF